MSEFDVDVAVVGGGPFGLMLANELGRRGVSVALFDQKASTATNPQANATQARTMEHFRRLGFADQIRSLGLPEDFPTDIAYFTRYAGHELGRFRLPSAKEAREKVLNLSGSWSAAELPHRVSQKFVEQVLREQAEALPGVSISFGMRMTAFEDRGDHVTVHVEATDGTGQKTVTARYLAAGDGARSMVRETFGFRYEGDQGAVRDFFGGRMYAVYLDAPDFYREVPHPPAWMNVTFNRDRRAFMAAVDGKGEFAFHTQLRPGEDEAAITDEGAIALFRAAVGRPVKARLLAKGSWTAGYALVSTGFQRGRVFLGGDAVHLFTPAGGLGYNTAVDDAVNLGWKLAEFIRGTAGPALLDSYEVERRPAAIRNTGYARGFADSLGGYVAPPEIEDDSAEGETARREAGAYLEAHGRAEFNIPGITFGVRYEGSPIIAPEAGDPPPDAADSYVPTARPGGRAPHLWLEPGVSLYDRFGFDWTLLQLGPDAPDATPFAEAAREMGLRLRVVPIAGAEARDLYEAGLALIRPDQVVAWRGAEAADARQVLKRALGFHDAAAQS
ncbi:FAD-dependent oxidoreductase [Alkalilacustris brevis]|uniref:FAD-dependent oxidoreductase n=1 Tax=Alkalilacustris brevis TaxID=2026338 RepID=UPI001EE3B207|nr:FAD-dependent oxidoreductase [Alkalilacustris brevis]